MSLAGLTGLPLHRLSLRRLFALVLAPALLVFYAGSAFAGLPRALPAEAKKVVMHFVGNGAVSVGDKALKLSPGAQIRDADSRLMLQGAVRGEFKVRAAIDINGQVSRVWILTPEEIATPDPKQ